MGIICLASQIYCSARSPFCWRGLVRSISWPIRKMEILSFKTAIIKKQAAQSLNRIKSMSREQARINYIIIRANIAI